MLANTEDIVVYLRKQGFHSLMEAADTIERYRTALRLIASCTSQHPEDVIAIARRALGNER